MLPVRPPRAPAPSIKHIGRSASPCPPPPTAHRPLPTAPPQDIRIEDLGPPDRIIAGFHPELYGVPLDDDGVIEQGVAQRGGLTYYQYLVKPHRWGGWAQGRAGAGEGRAGQGGLTYYEYLVKPHR